MITSLRLLVILSVVILPSVSFAGGLKSDVTAILKSGLSPQEAVDSALSVIRVCQTDCSGADAYRESSEVLGSVIIPFGLKHSLPPASLAILYDEYGQTFGRSGKTCFPEACEAFEKGLKYAVESGDFYRQGRIFEHMALQTGKYGDISDSFDLSEKAIAAYRRAPGNNDDYIVKCLYLQAVTYLRINDNSGLGEVVARLEKVARETAPETRPYALFNLYSVREAHYNNLYEASEGAQRELYLDSINQASLAAILLIESTPEWTARGSNPSWNYYNRAVLFVNTNDRPPMDSVIYYCDKALAVDHHGKTDIIAEVEISVSSLLAEAWMKNGNYARAKEILVTTLDKLDRAEGIRNLIIDKIQICKNLIEISRQTGRFEDAVDFYATLVDLEKQRYADGQAKAVKELEIKYETQETALALARSEARRSGMLMWLFAAVGLLLSVIVIFVVYAGRQRRQRMRREMEFSALRADTDRQLTRQYVEGLENERSRMARELHDGVCNDLLAIRMKIDNGTPVESTASLIDSCRESVRRISHELMPPEFAYASVDEVLRFFVRKQAEANKGRIAMSYESSAAGTLWSAVPDAVSLEVYRIVQEAVGNAVRHSGATCIDVSLRIDGRMLEVSVCDNGTYKSSGRKGLGLESIRRRAKAVNGTVDVIFGQAGGTEVRVRAKF